MIFHSPALLAAFALLPAIWWLLRARPPAPRTQVFPPIALLRRLKPEQNDASTPPLWLLLLRIIAVGLLIIGLAGPVLPGQPVALPGTGTLLLVLDDGLMSAADWSERNNAAHAILDAAAHDGRQVIFLRTAHSDGSDTTSGSNGAELKAVAPERATAVLDATRPAPWGDNRLHAAELLRTLAKAGTPVGAVLYMSDGIASGGVGGGQADAAFAGALRSLGPVQEIRFHAGEPVVLVSARGATSSGAAGSGAETSGVMARLVTVPVATPRGMRVRAHSQDGGTLALTEVTIPAGEESVVVPVTLPSAMRNRVDMLSVDGFPSAAATMLLDEGDRLRPVGLISTGASDTPLVGSLFYLHRALGPTADLREGTAASLLSQPLSVLVAPDGSLADADTRHRVAEWVHNGGTLIRFAGRTVAGHADDASDQPDMDAGQTDASVTGGRNPVEASLLPVPLMPAARQLGGTMSWGKPQTLEPFAADSPFHGLTVPQDVTVSRQVLAHPSADLPAHSWARLTDGTPLVTHAGYGKGEVVLFHVTPTADWSNLPLSGLFVDMLDRLVEHAAGVDAPADEAVLPPVLTLDGDGALGAPPPFARGLAASRFGTEPPSPEHPPGLYGSRASRRALNVGDTVRHLTVAEPVGTVTDPAGHRPDRFPGPALLAAALILLSLDACFTLLLRGLPFSWRRVGRRNVVSVFLIGGTLLAVSGSVPALAQGTGVVSPPRPDLPAGGPPAASPGVPGAALETRLAYVVTGNEETDAVSREGLQGLSGYVNARTSAVLGHPDGVRPGIDDLSYYPLLYWPIVPGVRSTPAMTSALTSFMEHGGMIIIDTQGVDGTASRGDDDASGSAGEAPGSAVALRRATEGLPVPPLTKLNDHHVLTHTFYLLHEFPGRYAGLPVWVAREGEAENDDVSPVIIGASDWAHAWAVDENGDTRFAVIPGGDDQRRMAYRFGVNAVIYALTGNYKADQVHVPAILRRLGQ
ncbi:DUF4159 domain-containing protein [Acetobacter oeni]|uniref:Double-region n=1 Tax=Acetobacter oeni TaxID=304077 RepID=A0A511XMW2_9PROT|nr:DUF4159 domain-containing protein [Acetobacter oeni]MBB3881498.1 hypothetical protein [Acetobacter oeni]NHO18362.1 DUF4159 domain-containing protein [Acetobacter oeni]GBR10820.1 hypothetical protein AA21952_3173 [Acetobacter oeni LMG 21952]GEN64284.1 double-region [Acetobacter oeni]